jgi:hypothetical protein
LILSGAQRKAGRVAIELKKFDRAPRTVSNETTIDDPALIERVAIAIFEKTQGSWEYAREADREWLRLEAQAAIVNFLSYIEERGRIFAAYAENGNLF